MQVQALSSVVDGLESSLGITRVELEGAVSRMKRGEVETRRVEDALQKLQNDLLKDLSEGMAEVKDAREKDFSSLERTVEERLAEVSSSIKASVAEFTQAQGTSQSQLADLRARMGDMEDPALLKQELSAIVEAVAELKAAGEASDASATSLSEQIGAVRAELQTRNQEVASISQDVENMRSTVQQTSGSLKGLLSAAEAKIQTLTDNSLTLESSVDQAVSAAQAAQKQAEEAVAQVQKQAEELEARVKATEESGEALTASVSDISSKVGSALTKLDSHESTLVVQGLATEKAKAQLEEAVEPLKSSLEELQSNMAALGDAQTEQTSRAADLAEQLQSLSSTVDGLGAKAAMLAGHDEAISTLQKEQQAITDALAKLSKPKEKQGKK